MIGKLWKGNGIKSLQERKSELFSCLAPTIRAGPCLATDSDWDGARNRDQQLEGTLKLMVKSKPFVNYRLTVTGGPMFFMILIT